MKVIYDIETLSNFFSYTDIDEQKNINVFVVCGWRNDLPDLLGHLSQNFVQIGYNNLAFDAIVLAYVLQNKSMLLKKNGEQAAKTIYSFVQSLIRDRETAQNFGLRPQHKQIDLFKINHFDNKARSTSLKALQCHIYWPNVQDMPFSHDAVIEESQMDEILGYNLNDVLSTKAFYELCHEKLKIRDTFNKIYKKDFTNKSDVAIGEEIFFRGLLHGALQQRFGARPAVVSEAGLFGLVHVCHHGLWLAASGWAFRPVSGLLWMLLMFCTALVFSALRQRSGSLGPAIAAHVAFNATMNTFIFAKLW